MAEPTPFNRADALIRANPRDRAVANLVGAVAANMDGDASDEDVTDAAAVYLLLANVEPDPTALLPRLRDLARLVAQHDAATTALGYAVSLADTGEHMAAKDRAWAEIVRVWGER